MLSVAVDGVDGLDPVIELYGRDGRLVAINNDSGPGLDPQIDFSVEMGGVYQLRVRNARFGDRVTGAYRLYIRDTP